MRDKKTILRLASAATFTLALQQGVLAEQPAQAQVQVQAASETPAAFTSAEPASPPAIETTIGAAAEAPASAATPAAPPPAVATPTIEPQPPQDAEVQRPETAAATPASPTPAMAGARERMAQRRAEMNQAREHRYEELRARAAEVGLELPETPPWDQPGMQPPKMAMPEAPGGVRGAITPEDRDARREQHYQMMRERAMQRGVEMPETPPWKLMNDEERQAHLEKMRNMTPEERLAMRDQHWQEMRQRAQERGIEMPETPPWKQAEQRRAEMKARWESYRETLDAMTPEQKEAVQAVFGPSQAGIAPRAMGRQTPLGMPMQAPYGQQGSGFPQGPGLPSSGLPGYGYGSGQPMQPGPAQGWYGGDQNRYQGPPPPPAEFNRRW